MKLRILKLLAGLFVLALVAAACGSSTTAIRVGDHSMSRGDVNQLVEDEVITALEGQGSADSVRGYLSNQAAAWLVEDAAIAQNIVLPGPIPVDVNAINQVFQLLIDAEVAQRIPDYGNNAGDLFSCARHILVNEEDVANDLIEQLADGGDFVALAAEFSTDGSSANGGNLGCAHVENYVPPFALALSEAAPGDVVGPVESQFGFHVIERLPVDPADPALPAAATREAFPSQEDFSDWMLSIVDAEGVEVDSRYGTWDTTQLSIVAE